MGKLIFQLIDKAPFRGRNRGTGPFPRHSKPNLLDHQWGGCARSLRRRISHADKPLKWRTNNMDATTAATTFECMA